MLALPYTPAFLPAHQFVWAAVLDFTVLIGWLLLVVIQPPAGARRWLYVLLGLASIAAILYTPRHRAPSNSPPPQKTAGVRPVSLVLTIHESALDQPWAAITTGVLPADPASQWTWTNERPHFRFLIEESDRWLFYLRFAASGAVLKAAGPQTIQIAINGVPVKTLTAREAREYELRFPVDPSLLKPGTMNDVELHIAPVLIAADGVPLGILLHAAGLVEDGNP